MKLLVSPFQLNGCKCRLKFDPKELQELLVSELQKKLGKKSRFLNGIDGELSVDGEFQEIDEGNFALHFLLAFLGKAWISGHYCVSWNNERLIDEPFHLKKTFAAFTNGRGQLSGDVKFRADLIVKRTIKALKQRA